MKSKAKEVVDKTTRLIEMQDEIENSIKNIDNVIKEQEELISFIEEKAEGKFQDLIKGLKESNEGYKKQKDTLTKRFINIQMVTLSLKDDATKRIIEALLIGLGLEEND